MLSKRETDRILQSLRRLEPPALAIYLPVELRSTGTNHEGAVRHELKKAGVPDEIMNSAVQRVADAGMPGGALVLLRSGDGTWVLEQEIAGTPPFIERDRPTVRWGEPFVAPIATHLSQSPRIAALHIDSRRARMFEIFLGEVELVYREEQGRPHGYDIPPSKQVRPAYTPSRGGAARDDAQDYHDHRARKFFRDVIADIAPLLDKRHIDGLIVMGPEPDVPKLFEESNHRLDDRLWAHGPSLETFDAPAEEVRDRALELAQPTIDERRRELARRVRDRGVNGLESSLRALQEGKLSALVLSEDTGEADLYLDPESGYVAAGRNEAALEGRPEARQLRDVLPDLAARFAVDLTVLCGAEREALDGSSGGIGGIYRWR